MDSDSAPPPSGPLPDEAAHNSAALRLNTAAVDARGRLTEWSPGAEQLLGYTAEDVLGQRALGLLFEKLSAAAWNAVATATAWSGVVGLRHRAGHRVAVELLAVPSTTESGVGLGWSVVAVAGAERCPPDEHTLVEGGFAHSAFATVLFDTDARVVRMSDVGLRAGAITDEQARGRRLPTEYGSAPLYGEIEKHVITTLRTGVPQHLEFTAQAPSETRERVWSNTFYPLSDDSGRVYGVLLCTLDITAEHLARERLALLDRASVQIGTTLDVERTALELASVTVPQFADCIAVDLLESVLRNEEPASDLTTSALELRRIAYAPAPENGGPSTPSTADMAAYGDASPTWRMLTEGLPVLLTREATDFAYWAEQLAPDARRTADPRINSVMVVPLSARGLPLGLAIFARYARPMQFTQEDLILAGELAARAGVCVDNARRYTHERATAVELQRSLLPQHLPSQSAVDVASRYLPAGPRLGVGGDWFDVIPLSGARVALVVGDVVGHGIRASAAMASLRTAVRTLADVDLAPDELLTQLDDLVIGWSASANSDQGDDMSGDIGATCLYAVYDPITRRCVLSRAGHLQPAVVTPDGSVSFLDLPAAPPLGLGGLPFEATETELAEGSMLVFFTDGLVESRDQDVDTGLDRLRDALSGATGSLEAVCDHVLAQALPNRPSDDVALLIARTRALSTDQVATWEVPADPSAVSVVRKQAAAQVEAWGLGDAVFILELVISELITNSIRYASAPITLRLIRDKALICEVSDASSTAPHMRRARVFDEGGRGLFLVAQFSQRWGSRQTPTGKTIWAEYVAPAD